jgi:hypothetical protein
MSVSSLWLRRRTVRLTLGPLVGDNGSAWTLVGMNGSTAPQAEEATRSVLKS